MKSKLIIPILVLILAFSMSTASAVLTNTTMLSDDFESDFSLWTDNGVTNWVLNTDQFVSGVQSAYAADRNVDDLLSDDLDMSDATEINITFSYRISGIDANDNVAVYYYDGVDYDLIDEIGDDVEGSWLEFSQVTTDAQYFDNGFHIYFEGSSIDNGEALWIDDVTIIKEHDLNSDPTVDNITSSHATIASGATLTIYANTTEHNVSDDDFDTLSFYCDTSTAPTAINTDCNEGANSNTTEGYNFTCTYAVQTVSGDYQEFCRVYDGTAYSNLVNLTYTIDATTLSTSIYSVAGDTSASYFDTVNDNEVEINITGEVGMTCLWHSLDTGYVGTSCTVEGDTANCTVTDLITQGYDTYYVTCKDSYNNEQNSSNNLDVGFYLDYTAPTTSDNGASIITAPPYTITITETDNVDGDPDTLYCTDTANTCNPSTAIDNGGIVTFTSANRGVNYLKYNSTDDASNQQTTQSQEININQLPTFTLAADNVTTIAGRTTINISTFTEDTDSSQEITLWVCNSTSISVSGCGDKEYCNSTEVANNSCTFTSETSSGTYIWYAYLYDELDEVATASKSGNYIVDSTAPTITITSPTADTTYTQESLTFTIATNEALTNAWYMINDTTNISMSNTSLTVYTHTNTSIDNGNFNVTFWANDSYGNEAQSNTIEFIIDATAGDTTAPTITIWNPTNDSYSTDADVLFNITANEDLQWAGYTDNDGTLTALVQEEATNWNDTITLTEGEHNITFFANDTSSNRNYGNTSIVAYVDLNNATIDSFSCDDHINDSINITCTANVNDTVSLNYVIIGYNATGTFQNSSQISLSGTSDTATYVIDNADTDPGNFTVELYVFDSASQMNYTSIEVNISDDTKPTIDNITYAPNTTLDLDPDVQINVSTDIADDYLLSNVSLFWKTNTASTWNMTDMTNTSLTSYNTSFTPENGTWQFKVYAIDEQGNENSSAVTELVVELDTNTTISTTVTTIKSFTEAQEAENNTVGDLILENAGDVDLNITVNISAASDSILQRLSVNYTTEQNITYEVSAGDTINISLEANITDLPVNLYQYNISVTYNPTIVYERYLNIQSADGPYLDVSITNYSSTIDAGEEIDLSATVTNLGTADATGVYLNWTLPSDWTITSGSANRDIGNLPLGVSATNTLTATVGSSGTVTITAESNATNADTNSDSKSVVVGTTEAIPTTPDESSSSSSGGGDGDASGGGGTSYTETEFVVEVVRGTEETIPITITNTYPDSILNDVTVNVDGFISQYVTISPSSTSGLLPGQSQTFNIIINAPAYLDQDEYQLTSKITGSIVYGNLTKNLIDKRIFTLLIQEISHDEVMDLLEQAKQDVADMKDASFTTTKIEETLTKAEICLEQRDNTCAKDLASQIHETRLTAFSTYNIIQEIKEDIDKSESKRLLVPETKNMHNLALAAFDREDYDTALQRIKDAQLTLALETKGRINIIWLVTTYWWALILGGIATYFIGIAMYKKFMTAIIAQRLKNLDKEEKTIQHLIKDSQKEAYVKKTISGSEYKTRLLGYDTRLIKIKALRAKLRHRRVAIRKKEEQIKDIEKERAEVIGMIKHAQKKYFTLGKISRERYNEEIETERERLAEIEDERATLETELAKEQLTKKHRKKFSLFERKILAKAENKQIRKKREKKISLKPKRTKRKLFRRKELKVDMSSNQTRKKNKARKHFQKLGFKVKKSRSFSNPHAKPEVKRK